MRKSLPDEALDYVKGFVFSPIRFTGDVDLYTLSIEK